MSVECSTPFATCESFSQFPMIFREDVTPADRKHSVFTRTALPPLLHVKWFAFAGWYSTQELGVEGWTVERTLSPNIGIIGLDPGFVGSVQIEHVSRFNTAGLRVHEVESRVSSADVVGANLDLEHHHTQITNSQCWKMRLDSMFRRKPRTGKCLEVIIGHCTFLGDLPRCLLFHPSEFSHSRENVALSER